MPPASFWGMQLAHLGIAVFVDRRDAGRAATRTRRTCAWSRATPRIVGGYAFQFMGVRTVPGPNYTAARGEFEVSRDGSPGRTLFPEKRTYPRPPMPMTKAAIDTGFTRDVYVSLGEPLEGAAPGACACTTSPSSTGSGAAAC